MIFFQKHKIYILIIILILDFQNILINIFFYINIYIIKKLNNNILIEIDTSNINSPRGPGIFLKGINKILPFSSNNCSFISSSFINFIFKKDYYYIPIPRFEQNHFQKLIQNKIINKYIF